ncbi:MAG: hypothetical protein K2X48_12820 [Chitinophagaceae bacterium]|nr:hypothetical protein [Chitinophagaceae bacterium]
MNVIDNLIHQERLDKHHLQKTFAAILNTLPGGVFVQLAEDPAAYLWQSQQLYAWSFSGYQKTKTSNSHAMVQVLTPASYVEVFRCGYEVQVHATAGG